MSTPAATPAATPVPPRATYRLQLRGGVGLREARALVPYLATLGVSHLYCSPLVQARAGSDHGYDVVDPTRIDAELGDEADFEALARCLREHGMGLLLDWVPNHVGIAQGQNPWWQELLAFGPGSRYAEYFDVDWTPRRRELRGKVLLPVLGRPYGDALEAGELEPVRGPEGGLLLHYFEHRFPISPASWGRLLQQHLLGAGSEDDPHPELRRLLAALVSRAGGRATRAERALAAQRRLDALLAAEPVLLRRVEALVETLRGAPGRPESFDALHHLLERQHYRLAYWRVAAEEINYRRFFDVNELAAVRMERSEVFDHVHQSVFRWIEAGMVDGLRIDHVDGLADPRAYCERIRRRFAPERLHLVVEKILGDDEPLPESWPVDGTTGYELLNQLNGLFVDPRGARPLERLTHAFTGAPRDFERVVHASKLRVMRSLLASEIDGLASALDRIAQGDRHSRDFTAHALHRALVEVIAAFPVYRSYVGPGGASEEDRRRIAGAVAAARARSEDPDSGLAPWLERVLSGDLAASEPSAARRRALRRFVTRFEQVTAPVTAKGVEDTAFYRDVHLLSLNEVGGDPRRFGWGPEELHEAQRERAERWPRALVSTSTHDTKRGEDVRLRLDVLSEWPREWAETLRTWARLNRSRLRRVHGERAPAAKDELFLYQVLVGSFPLEPAGQAPGPELLGRYRKRLRPYLVKALREAKERSSWRHPDPAYEEAVCAFADDLLAPEAPFLRAFLPFQGRVAERAATTGLAQVALKLAAPGVPDVYQGCEGWDLSLADPDNRRPVDFAARQRDLEALAGLVDATGAIPEAALAALRHRWRDGRIKHLVTWRLLALRRERPELFVGAGYLPLKAEGEREGHVVGFARLRKRRGAARGHDARGHDGEALVVVAPRLCADLPRSGEPFPLGEGAWGGTRVRLPASLDGSVRWRDGVTGARRRGAEGGTFELGTLFDSLPLAVLVPERGER